MNTPPPQQFFLKNENGYTDIFAGAYSRWIDFIFRCLVPVSNTGEWALLRMLYKNNYKDFKLHSSLHSNDYEDKLHFSVRYMDGENTAFTLHIYGFWKGNDFRTKQIDMVYSNCKQPSIVAQFNFNFTPTAKPSSPLSSDT